MFEEQEKFTFVVEKMIEVIMFENWVRYYFIQEMKEENGDENDETQLFVIIPEKGMNNIKTLYPDFYSIAEEVNNKKITFDISQNVVCSYIVQNIDGKIIPRDTAPSVMNSVYFKTQLQLFHTWVQLHEDQLDMQFMDFGTWQRLYSDWKESAKAKELAEKLFISLRDAPAAHA